MDLPCIKSKQVYWYKRFIDSIAIFDSDPKIDPVDSVNLMVGLLCDKASYCNLASYIKR